MQPQVNIDVTKLEDIVCNQCDSKYWEQVMMCKVVPALLSPNGKETIVNIPTLLCYKCGKEINKVIEENETKNKLKLV